MMTSGENISDGNKCLWYVLNIMSKRTEQCRTCSGNRTAWETSSSL